MTSNTEKILHTVVKRCPTIPVSLVGVQAGAEKGRNDARNAVLGGTRQDGGCSGGGSLLAVSRQLIVVAAGAGCDVDVRAVAQQCLHLDSSSSGQAIEGVQVWVTQRKEQAQGRMQPGGKNRG